jgi:hypothetical protein
MKKCLTIFALIAMFSSVSFAIDTYYFDGCNEQNQGSRCRGGALNIKGKCKCETNI